MKKRIVALALILTFVPFFGLGFSQDDLSGFFGSDYGYSVDDAMLPGGGKTISMDLQNTSIINVLKMLSKQTAEDSGF